MGRHRGPTPPAGRSIRVGWRLLTARPARFAAGVTGIGFALMIVLLLDGLWTGVQRSVTVYDDNTGAQLAVVAPGTETLFADPSLLPEGVLARVAAAPGVAAASPVVTTYAILDLRGGKVAVALVGSEPGGLGGPRDFASGHAPADGEVAVDSVMAAEHGLQIGDTLPVLGADLPIVGLTRGTAMFMTPLVFTTEATATGLLQAPRSTGAVLVATADSSGVAQRLRAQGFTVRTQDQLHEASLRLATQVYGGPVRLMVGIAFVAGVLVVALVSYTAVEEHRRDFGVLKALGATPARVHRITLAQTGTLTAFGAGVASLLTLTASALIGAWRPDFPVAVTAASLTRAAVTVAMIAATAAWVPARRVTRVDAASAFRSGS